MTAIIIATTAFISISVGTLIGIKIERRHTYNQYLEIAEKMNMVNKISNK